MEEETKNTYLLPINIIEKFAEKYTLGTCQKQPMLTLIMPKRMGYTDLRSAYLIAKTILFIQEK